MSSRGRTLSPGDTSMTEASHLVLHLVRFLVARGSDNAEGTGWQPPVYFGPTDMFCLVSRVLKFLIVFILNNMLYLLCIKSKSIKKVSNTNLVSTAALSYPFSPQY